jgi:Ser/Thr protein kinase RdoA (MazF antagonist)
MTSFPVTASTLSENELGIFAIERYGLHKNSSCKLFRTGINHTYFLFGNGTRYVFRVYSYGWRSKNEIREEINLLTLLKENGMSVSHPILDKNREFIQEIDAPEGIRYAVLFTYAEGNKVRFMDDSTCYSIGSLMAQIHQITSQNTIERTIYDDKSLLELPYEYAKEFFSERLPEMEFVKATCNDLSNSFKHIDSGFIPSGIVHLDIWYDNMSITDKGDITIFDFDFCGNGFLILDVAYFCKQLFRIEADKQEYKRKAASFLNGYQSVRKLSNGELTLIPDAGAAIWIFYLGVQCQRFDWSNIFLTENYLKMYIAGLKSWREYHRVEDDRY